MSTLVTTVNMWQSNPFQQVNNQTLQSNVISITISDITGVRSSPQIPNSPATIQFSNVNNSNNAECAYYNTTNNKWQSDGVTTSTTAGGQVQCTSTHLTDFALINNEDQAASAATFFSNVKIVYVIIIAVILGIGFLFWAKSKDSSFSATVGFAPNPNDSEMQEIQQNRPTLTSQTRITSGAMLLMACDPVAMFSRKSQDFSHISKGFLYFMRIFALMLINTIILKVIDAGDNYTAGQIILSLALSLVIVTPFSFGYAHLLKPIIVQNVKRRVTNDNENSLYWAGVGLIVLTIVGAIVGTLVIANMGTASMNTALIIAFFVCFGLDAAVTQGVKAFVVKS